MTRLTQVELQHLIDNGARIANDSPVNAKQLGMVSSKEELIPAEPYTGPEIELQKAAESYLTAKGYEYLHIRKCRGNKAGWPDLTVLVPNGRVVFIELKVKSGRLSAEQKDFQAVARAGNHVFEVCRSIEQVIQVIKQHSEV